MNDPFRFFVYGASVTLLVQAYYHRMRLRHLRESGYSAEVIDFAGWKRSHLSGNRSSALN